MMLALLEDEEAEEALTGDFVVEKMGGAERKKMERNRTIRKKKKMHITGMACLNGYVCIFICINIEFALLYTREYLTYIHIYICMYRK